MVGSIIKNPDDFVQFALGQGKVINQMNVGVSRDAVKMEYYNDIKAYLTTTDFQPNSVMNTAKLIFDEDDNEGSVLSEDFDAQFDNFINSINIDDANWEFKTEMSPNLLRLCGLTHLIKPVSDTNNRDEKSWDAPQYSGLGNSEPIVRTAGNSRSESKTGQYNSIVDEYQSYKDDDKNSESGGSFRGSDSGRFIPSDIKQELMNRSSVPNAPGYRNDAKYDSDAKDYNRVSSSPAKDAQVYQSDDKAEAKVYAAAEEEEEEEEEDDDEDDDDDDDDDEEYDEVEVDGDMLLANMSANLMAAIGMDTSKVDVATDWKPPAQSGMQNSARIIA